MLVLCGWNNPWRKTKLVIPLLGSLVVLLSLDGSVESVMQNMLKKEAVPAHDSVFGVLLGDFLEFRVVASDLRCDHLRLPVCCRWLTGARFDFTGHSQILAVQVVEYLALRGAFIFCPERFELRNIAVFEEYLRLGRQGIIVNLLAILLACSGLIL